MKRERGFTLIELVLALSIVAMMLVILFSGLRVSIRSWQRGEERANALEHARSIEQLVQQTLAGVYPFQGQLDQNTAAQILFKGEADRVSFATLSSPFPLGQPIAFTAITLSMEAGSTSAGLAIRQKALPNFDPFEEVKPILIDSSITAVRFRYLRDPDAGTWEDTWDGLEERATPRAIEVTLTTVVNGQIQEQPPITVPVRVTAP
jgi:general secretion pathway protein J